MSAQQIPLEKFPDAFGATTELSSVAIGGRVLSVSDEFFAEAFHLLLVEPAPSLKGQFGPNGALYSGWESRRHNPSYDWCIIKLGTSGTIVGFDIDTTHFNGNEAPQASVDAFYDPSSGDLNVDDSRWTEILPKVNLGPSSRHLFTLPTPGPCATFVKLNMYPDGGIARFRVYGHVSPIIPAEPTENFDLAHVFAGGRVEFTSDQHFGVGSNLILPGRGKDMGDGWETKRSRQPGHKDWAIIKLAVPGFLEHVEIDTAHFKGNFPESCEIHALRIDEHVDWKVGRGEDKEWMLILPRTKLGPHRQHYFQLENVERKSYTHVIQAYGDHTATPKGIKITPANGGTASKFHKLSLLSSSYDSDAGATTGLSVYRCQPLDGVSADRTCKLQVLERHAFTNQAFIPMGSGPGEGLQEPGQRYLVVVAKNGEDGRPDLKTLRAFVASTAQGIVYNTGIWHQPMTVLEKPLDFTCVETQIGDGSKADCEIIELEESIRLRLP
ncbi:allantoicase [Moniliophthora roreri]|nr:allantoicase [Moniliophthora roreri]